MLKKFHFCLFILFLYTPLAYSQSFKLNQVTLKELKMTEDEDFPEAAAIVLERNVKVDVSDYVEVYERIKILNTNGLEYGTINFPYYNVTRIKGFTHNLVDNSIASTKLTEEMEFTEKVDVYGKKLKDQKVAFPKVSVGSVIEIYYKANKGTYSDIIMQYDIPIRLVHVEVLNSSYSNFKIVQNPRSILDIYGKRKKDKFIYDSKDVPPLEQENYVFDMEQYRAKLILKGVGSMYSADQFESWDGFPYLLMNMPAFANKTKAIYREEIKTLVENQKDPLKRCQLVYNYIQEHIKWTKEIGIYAGQGNEETFTSKSGNTADINMLLVSVLRSVGLQAYPVLASTKMNGLQANPSVESFDYLMAGINIEGKWRILDAAYPDATFDYIPQFMINWKGMIVKAEDDYEWFDLTQTKLSKRLIIGTANVLDDLSIEGGISERRTGYFAISMNNAMEDDDMEDEDFIDISVEGLDFRNIELSKGNAITISNLKYDFQFEDSIETIGDNYYLSPLSFLSLDENPFKNSTRKFPVDFGHNQSTEYLFTWNLPENIQVVSIPDPIKMIIPNNIGSYYYRIDHSGNQLKVLMKFEINNPFIEPQLYQGLKDFVAKRVAKENEKIILKTNK